MASKLKLVVNCEGENKYVHVEPGISLADLKCRVAAKFGRSERDIRLKKKVGDRWVLLKADNLALKEKDALEVTKKILGFGMRAIMPKNKLWKENGKIVDSIRVCFLNDPPEGLMHQGQPVTTTLIFNLIEYYWDFTYVTDKHGVSIGEHVPRFQKLDKPQYAHVRVKFEVGLGNFSALATDAMEKEAEDATMILDLTEKGIDIQFTVVHEFGHVLGLYHEHQHPDYIEVMERFQDEDNVMELSGIEDFMDYQRQFGMPDDAEFKYDYDFESIMHYPTSLAALREEYQGKITEDPKCLDKLLETGEIDLKEKKILEGFVNHINHVKPKPSDKDLLAIAEAYYTEYNKLNPSPKRPTVAESAFPKLVPQPLAAQQPPAQPASPKMYLGKEAPNMRDLSFVKNPAGGRPFKLLPKIGDNWRDIGELLGIEDSVLKQWSKLDADDRLRKIFGKWRDNAMNLEGDSKRYSYTWQGLYNLLEDAEYEEVAKSYFEFLEKMKK